jgi:hypothetical protein
MSTSPFDRLPPPDPQAFRRAIKRHLTEALQSLAKFSDSIRSGRPPEWPPQHIYALFMAQLRAFRLIWKRKGNVTAIQLLHEIDHRWSGLKVVKTVVNCADQLNNYLSPNLLGSANVKAEFERQNDRTKDHFGSLLLRKKLASPEDLELMYDLLPPDFQKLIKLTCESLVRSAPRTPSDTMQKLRIAVARSSQEYLICEHQRLLAKFAAADALRKFLFGLRHRPFTKKLFGFSAEQIEEWGKLDSREAARLRKRRFDDKKRAKKRYNSP